MAPTTTMTIRLPQHLRERLDALAKATDRSRAYWASRAIEEYLAAQEWQVEAIAAAVREADLPDACFLEHPEVLRRVDELKKRPAKS